MKNGMGLEKKLTLMLLAFAVVICAAIWSIGYKTYMDSTFATYRTSAESVLKLAITLIDADDMKNCLDTGVKSETYQKTQAYFDGIKENMNISYLYAFKVAEDGKIMYYITAVTEEELQESAGTKINSLGDEDKFPGYMTRRFLLESHSGAPFVEIVNKTEYGYMLSVYSPMADSQGKIIGLVGVDFDMNEINAELTSYGVTVAVDSIAITVLFTILLISFVRRNVTVPVRLMARKAGEFAASSRDEPLLAIKLDVKNNDEIGILASSFEKMTEDLVRYVAETAAAISAKQHIESELGIARAIQAGILPSTFPPFPSIQEFDLYASMTPAREVGGDFYDFFMTDDSHVALVIADVSGKGVPAALFMMVARTLIKNEAYSGGGPDEILERVNATLCEENSTCMFVTVFMGIYNMTTGLLQYSSAGHNPPVVINARGEKKILDSSQSIVLAIDETARYSLRETVIEPGGCILLYTDGVTEAFSEDGEIFSEARLLDAMNSVAGAKDIVENILDELRKFVRGAEQSDDITLLALVRK